MPTKQNIEKTKDAKESASAKTFEMPLLSVNTGSNGISVYSYLNLLKNYIKEMAIGELITLFRKKIDFQRIIPNDCNAGKKEQITNY